MYTECKDLKLPVVEDNLPLYDFLQAVSEVSPEFSSFWTVNLEQMESDNKSLPDIFRIIGLFRDHQRLASARKGKAASAFPASLKDQSLDSGPADPKDPKPKDSKEPKSDSKKRPCICGLEHMFSACPYLIESIRPQGWTADPEVQKKVDEKLKLPNVKAAVERARKRIAKGKDQDTPSSPSTRSSDSSEKTGVFVAASYAASNSSDYNL